MNPSIREQIIIKLQSYAAAALGLEVQRSRTNPISKNAAYGVYCYAENERNSEQMNNRTTRELSVKFCIFVRGDEPDRLADFPVSTLVNSLLTDHRVGGLATQIQETSTEWDFDSDVSEDYGTATVSFLITYTTNRVDQTSAQ